MTQHTKGPWRVSGVMLGHEGDVYAPTAKKIPDCHHIARCFAPKLEKPIVCELQALGAKREAVAIIEANAKLIAAAPELLEALQRARGTIQWAVYQHDIGTPYRKTDEEILAQIDAVIAKAVQS